jgi:deazaflavin-dependent oxidoreductase (nitroreductase family)
MRGPLTLAGLFSRRSRGAPVEEDDVKPRGSAEAVLTHFGRKTAKPYRLKVWWVEMDGAVWIGSMDRERGWVRNVKATGRAELDRGSGPVAIACEWVDDPADVRRFAAAITKKYPIMSRLLRALFEREPCAFRTRPRDERA